MLKLHSLKMSLSHFDGLPVNILYVTIPPALQLMSPQSCVGTIQSLDSMLRIAILTALIWETPRWRPVSSAVYLIICFMFLTIQQDYVFL